MKRFWKVTVSLITALGLITCAGCGGKSEDESTDKAPETNQSEAAEAPGSQEEAKEEIVLRVFSTNPDRQTGLGKVEQAMLDEYTSAHPNVTFEVESITGDAALNKIRAYTASNDMPDLWFISGVKSIVGPMVDGGHLMELNPADYEKFNYLPGSTDFLTYDGKMYGLPLSTDMMVMYYNQKLFDDAGVAVPATLEELKTASGALRDKGIMPLSFAGKEKWEACLMYQTLAAAATGDQKVIYQAVNQETTFAGDEGLKKAAEDLKGMNDAKVFQDGFSTADSGIAKNLFGQQQAAMYYSGSWELSMINDEAFPQEFRDNVHVALLPIPEDSKGAASDMVAWYGASMLASAKTEHPDVVKDVISYIADPEHYAKMIWSDGAAVPAQDISAFTGEIEQTRLQEELMAFFSKATSTSGTTWNDVGTAEFKTNMEDNSQGLITGVTSPEEFLKTCDQSAQAMK